MVRDPRTWGREMLFLTIRKSTNFHRVGQESELCRTNLLGVSEC